MVRSVLRIVVGYLGACLAAGATQTLFVVTPADLAADWERAGGAGVLMLMAATQSAVFALPFAAIAIAYTEWFAARGWPTSVFFGIAIAATAYAATVAGEATGTTILNDYALKAFLTAGLAAGLVYWLIAGRRAGAWHRRAGPPAGDVAAA